MLRRRPWHRSLAAMFALWLVALWAEPAALHPCPMHDGVAIAGTASGAGAAHAMAGHAGSGAHHAPGRHDNHRCTCLGACCGVARIAVPAPLAAIVVAVAIVPAPRPLVPPPVLRPTEAEHARPPTVGPPTLHEG